VSIHQRNHARLLSLRATSTALDEQICSTLTLLTETRAELVATPATAFSENTNPVSYSELLSYARRISKFTIPPEYREAEISAENGAVASQELEVRVDTPGAEVKTNGTSTPVISNGAAVPSNGELSTATPIEAENTTALPQAVSEWLNPLAGGPAFVPWPTEETIRRGALASIQILLNQGVDPATFDPGRSAELEAERKRLEEEAECAREEQEAERKRAEMERRALMEQRRRESAAAGGTVQEQRPAVFTGLDLLDDEDDD
jgi:hypothetical protein